MKLNQLPLWSAVICIVCLHSTAQNVASNPPAGRTTTEVLLQELSAQGVPQERIFGTDANGVPILCGTVDAKLSQPSPSSLQPQNEPLPANTRAWECIPCVIRFDGRDSFRLEVNANGPVKSVSFQCSTRLIPASGGAQQTLRDDGLGGDRVAGDFIFTSVPMVANTNINMGAFYFDDTNSPAGLYFVDLAVTQFDIVETNGVTNAFLIQPQIGFLSPNIPERAGITLSSNIVASDHLINIRSPDQYSQKYLHQIAANIQPLVQEMYASVPDLFDFLMFFSTDHVEWLPRTTSGNFNAGIHTSMQVNYTGTGLSPFNNSGDLGSKGRLLSINFIDTNSRGTYAGNATHEILHQWLIFTSHSLGLDDGTAHFVYNSSAASLLGGFQWIPNGNNNYIFNCAEGRNGAHFAPPLDKYMMGLIEGTNVPPILFYSLSLPPPLSMCGTNLVADHSTTIDQIQTVEGIRTPRPASAQKEFFIGFIAETRDRLFNATERTFYDILAEHYTKPLPQGSPAPYVGFTWPSIDRFFGEGTRWHSQVIPLIQPQITSITRNALGNVQLSGTAAPTTTYTLQGATNFSSWSNLGTVTTTTNGSFQAADSSPTPQKFYRLRWP